VFVVTEIKYSVFYFNGTDRLKILQQVKNLRQKLDYEYQRV